MTRLHNWLILKVKRDAEHAFFCFAGAAAATTAGRAAVIASDVAANATGNGAAAATVGGMTAAAAVDAGAAAVDINRLQAIFHAYLCYVGGAHAASKY